MKPPNILLSASNPYRMINNISHIIDPTEVDKLQCALRDEAKHLYILGMAHFKTSERLPWSEWRSKVSRLYYCAYNQSRSVRLLENGAYSTDVKDHDNLLELPPSLNNRNLYINKLKNFRSDRNSCDYDHRILQSDLTENPRFYRQLVIDFTTDVKEYLTSKGVTA